MAYPCHATSVESRTRRNGKGVGPEWRFVKGSISAGCCFPVAAAMLDVNELVAWTGEQRGRFDPGTWVTRYAAVSADRKHSRFSAGPAECNSVPRWREQSSTLRYEVGASPNHLHLLHDDQTALHQFVESEREVVGLILVSHDSPPLPPALGEAYASLV